jgi:uncharacterized membrane-anchored protein YjiN (DUF445 family)
MKHLPLILLALMAALFLVTLGRPEAWVAWVNAFAEAGMVGALADWFAVVALFRHPLGIPIPHTAIIPSRKDRIGENLARFIAEHFLHPDVVRVRLASVNLAGTAAKWLKSPSGEARAIDLATRLAGSALDALGEDEVRRFLGRIAGRQLAEIDPARLMGRGLAILVEDGRHEELLTQALRFALVSLHDNRERIRGQVRQGSPWWLPGFADDRIVVEMLDRIEALLLEMSLVPDHPMRRDFDQWTARWASELANSPDFRQRGEGLRDGLAENRALQSYLYEVWQDLAAALSRELENPESVLREEGRGLLRSLADELERDGEMQLWLNAWLLEAGVGLVEGQREAIAGVVSDTVRSWDAVETSSRIEAAIGRDLQFIRVNGTLVGGLVGVLIHAYTLLAGGA